MEKITSGDPEEDTVIEYVHGDLSEEALQSFESHLEQSLACKGHVTAHKSFKDEHGFTCADDHKKWYAQYVRRPPEP